MKNILKIFTVLSIVMISVCSYAEDSPERETIDLIRPGVPTLTVATPTIDTSRIRANLPTIKDEDKALDPVNGKCKKNYTLKNNKCVPDHVLANISKKQRATQKESDEMTCESKHGRWDKISSVCWCGATRMSLTDAEVCTKNTDKEYDKDVNKIIDAYNTVTKKILSKCVAEGTSIEDCKTK